MDEIQIWDIYLTLTGQMQEKFRVPGVENLFADGSECACDYTEMSKAYARLRQRLGVIDEDRDVEIIINSLLSIEQKVSIKMFEYGMKFANMQKNDHL